MHVYREHAHIHETLKMLELTHTPTHSLSFTIYMYVQYIVTTSTTLVFPSHWLITDPAAC